MAEETQEQKDERMAWELFPDIPRSSRNDPTDFGAFLEKTVAADSKLSEAVDIASAELRAESAEHRLAEALQLLEAAKDCLPSDDLVYLRIRDFLDQK